jgi:predicted TIM-barrel fold metal-dependent hydrolase
MKNNRRLFLKNAGIVGVGAAGAILLPGCNIIDSDSSDAIDPVEKSNINWRNDPEWREVKYGSWGGPGVPDGPGPMDTVLLKDYAPRSSVVAQETFIPKALYPVIDVHVHSYYPEQEEGKDEKEALVDWVKTQEEVGIKLSVVMTGATGEEFDKLVEIYLKPYPEQFQLYCGILGTDIDKPDYPERAVAELERCYKKGARGVGEISDKGFGVTGDRELNPNERLHHTDIRLEPFWNKCADLNLPVNIHIADHPSSWQPPDVFQERTPIFQQFNQSDEEGLPYDQLLDNLPLLLEKHPRTTFIACHLANLGNDLQRLGGLLDKYPNLYLDISARDYEVGRQPRASAKFLAAYPTRVLFGTDMGMVKSMYQSWWRLLESDDEHMTGRVWWRYYGLDLAAPVLENLYHDNAMKIMNWEKI